MSVLWWMKGEGQGRRLYVSRWRGCLGGEWDVYFLYYDLAVLWGWGMRGCGREGRLGVERRWIWANEWNFGS
jgi:hypothetical protein